jgi:hypothetical protein
MEKENKSRKSKKKPAPKQGVKTFGRGLPAIFAILSPLAPFAPLGLAAGALYFKAPHYTAFHTFKALATPKLLRDGQAGAFFTLYFYGLFLFAVSWAGIVLAARSDTIAARLMKGAYIAALCLTAPLAAAGILVIIQMIFGSI